MSRGVRKTSAVPSRTARKQTVLRSAGLFAVLALLLALTPSNAFAWKPFTHNLTGSLVQADLANDQVTINGHEYPVNSQVDGAIKAWPAYYSAGVIGPDGFPDIAFGQAVIHPGDPASTGSWLGYLLQQAWAAQTDPGYDNDQRGQILAFTYGFLTHAAGDTWAHTLMNDYAGGVFPSVKEVVTKLPAAQIALRHLITEGYIGAATAGFDSKNAEDSTAGCNNPDTSPPDTTCNPGTADETRVEVSRVCADAANPPTDATSCNTEGPGGADVTDFSANAAPGIEFAVPAQWLQNTMVSLSAHPPTDDCDHDADGDPGCPNGTYDPGVPSQLTRGPVLDAVLDEEAKLQIYAAKTRYDADHTMCTTLDKDCHDITTILQVATVRGFATVQVPDTSCTAQVFCVGDVVDVANDVVDDQMATYAEHWVEDIDAMRAHWSDFSLAVTKALFDPQMRRDAANELCSYSAVGPETLTNSARNQCEAGVGAIDTVRYALGHVYTTGNPSWIDRYLLPAAGLPDFVGGIDGFLTAVGDAIDGMFTYIGISNPLAQINADVNAFIDDQLNGWVEDQYGISPEAISQFQESPTQWMCGTDANNPASLSVPGIGTVTPGGLFTPDEHARLDTLMGLSADHHEAQAGLPVDCSPLADDAKLDPTTFAPLKNTVTLGKLLLLDGPGLDQVLGDTLVDAGVIKNASVVSTYGGSSAGFPANVMVDGFTAVGTASHTNDFGALSTHLPWLQLIDGDHAWRRDGLPRFCDNDGSGGCAGQVPSELHPQPRALPTQLTGQTNGGNGNMPMWESCLLRPAFRSLFTDWENGGQNFPDLGDAPSPDASDPNAPQITELATGQYVSGGTTYVGANNRISLSASDPVFTDSNVALRYRVFKDGTTLGPDAGWNPLTSGDQFSVSGTDGTYHVQYQAQNPCHTFDPTDALASPIISKDFVLDSTGPTISFTSPAPQNRVFDTASTSTISYSVTDAASGVKSSSVTLDGTASSNGATLDMFLLYPGSHTVSVAATDNLDNPSSASRSFSVAATSASLLSNLDRARALGLVPDTSTYTGLRDKLVAALSAHKRGQHTTEWNQLSAFISLLQAQRGQGISAPTADRFIAYARDLIARRG